MPRESDLTPGEGEGEEGADSCRMADLMGMMRRPLFMLFMFRGRNGKKGFPVGGVCVCVALSDKGGRRESPLVREEGRGVARVVRGVRGGQP